MRFLVDEMPEVALKCPFAKLAPNSFKFWCDLAAGKECTFYHGVCPRLVTIDEILSKRAESTLGTLTGEST